MTVAKELRDKGQTVEYALFDTMELVREYAKEKGIGRIVVVGEEVTEVE